MLRLALLTSLLALLLAPAAQAAPATKRLPRPWAAANKLSPAHAQRDADRDGLTNWGEYRAATNPRRRDSDRDGLADALEDRDRDRLVNADEVAAGTDPARRDSDRDRVADGREDRDRDGLGNADERSTGHELRTRDTDGDGVVDGRDNAGWITASSTTAIMIRLATGGTLSARVTGDSFMDCSGAAAAETSDQPAADSSRAPSGDEDAGSTTPDGSDDDIAYVPAPDADVPAVEDDPAGLPAAFSSVDDEGDQHDAAADLPDLGTCAADLRVGAVVFKAAVKADPAGPVLTDLKLLKR